MTTTLIFGGTFDPVHHGHLRSAQALLKKFDDARLVMIPCQIPPHRPQPEASPDNRLQMLNAAIADEERISVDDCELTRGGKSFTYDTLKAYRDAEPESKLYFVLGVDAWVTLPTWYRWQELTDLAHLIVLTRPGRELIEPEELKTWAATKLANLDAISSEAGNVVKLTLEQFPISATGVRKALHEGRKVDECVPKTVTNYIEANELYT